MIVEVIILFLMVQFISIRNVFFFWTPRQMVKNLESFSEVPNVAIKPHNTTNSQVRRLSVTFVWLCYGLWRFHSVAEFVIPIPTSRPIAGRPKDRRPARPSISTLQNIVECRIPRSMHIPSAWHSHIYINGTHARFTSSRM